MARSNAEIQREYASKGTLAKIGIAADDLVRIAAGGITGGLLDQVLGGNNAELTQEARVRAGLAGDVTNVAGMAAGLKGAGTALKGTVGAVRAAPTAAAVAQSAGPAAALRFLTNTAGPGLVPVAANAVSKGALAKGAGLLGLLGLSIAGRQDPGTPAAAPAVARATPQPAAAAPKPTAKPVITPQDRAMAAIDTILSQPFTLREFETATGALPVVASATTKGGTAKDKVFSSAAGIADMLYQAQLAQASKLTGDARDQAVYDATEKYRANLLETLGIDPSKQALADAMAAAQAGE